VAYAKDRICNECGTRYAPPTPRWAGWVFILIGIPPFAVWMFVIFARMEGNRSAVNAYPCFLLFGVIGMLCIGKGFATLVASKKKLSG